VRFRGHTPATVAYYVSYIALGLSLAATGPNLSRLAEQTGSVLSEISYLFTAISLGYMAGAALGGRVFDRIRGHPALALMMLVIAVFLALVPLASTLWMLIVVMFVLGAVQSAMDVGANTLLTWIHQDNLGPYMNALHFFFGVGAFLSPILVAQMAISGGGILWTYWTMSLLMLPVAIWFAVVPSPPIRPERVEESGQTDRLLILLIVVAFFLTVGVEVGFAGWIFTYALNLDLANETWAAYLTSAFWGSFTVGRLVGIPIAVRFRPQSILIGDLLGCVLSVGMILFWPGSRTVLWLGAVGLGFSLASVFATLLSLAGEYLHITGKITGWFFVGTSSGAMMVPWMIGQLFESWGANVTMVVLMGNLLLGLGTVLMIMLYLRRAGRLADDRTAA
jgi:FHS family Na+ dependent glucose MFS transporter 1